MFHYTHHHTDFLRTHPLSIDPRERYLAAVADAKAAEAEYFAAESIQREEQVLRRRLEEIQLQKQFQDHPLRLPTYGQVNLTSPFDVRAHGYDHLPFLRRHVEEQERVGCQVNTERLVRQVEESKRLRQLEEEKRLCPTVALRQAELEREARLLLALGEKRTALLRGHLARHEQPRQLSQECFVRERIPSRQAEVTLHPNLQAILGKEVNAFGGPPQSKPTRELPVKATLPELLEQLLATCVPASHTTAPSPPQPPMLPDNVQEALKIIFGGSQSAMQLAQAPTPHQEVEGLEKFLELALSASTQGQALQAAPSVSKSHETVIPSSSRATSVMRHSEVENLMDALLGGHQRQASQGPDSSSEAQAAQSSSSQVAPQVHNPSFEGFQQFLDLFTGSGHQQQESASSKAPAAQPSPPQAAPQAHYPHPEGFQQLLNLFGGYQQRMPQASASSKPQSTAAAPPEFMNIFLGQPAKEQQPQAKPSPSATSGASQQAASPESSLKAELESRLGNEYGSEVRDTIQAILASLSDSSMATAPSPAPSPSAAAPSSSAGSSKGKEKALGTTTTPARSLETATSKDVIQSLDEVRNIEAAFSALETDFCFPSQLDFLTSHLSSNSPTSSDSEASAISHLAYTSRNHPVRFYEQALGSLLSQLDLVDSLGNEDLRVKRKHVVDRVEKALEELESEVEGRWRTRVAKELKSFKVTATDAVAPSEALVETSDGTVSQTTLPDSTPRDAYPKAEDAVQSPVVPEDTPAPRLKENSNPLDTPLTGTISIDKPFDSSQAEEETGALEDIATGNTSEISSSTAVLAESAATIRPTNDAVSPAESEVVDTFLLPASPPAESTKPKHLPSPERDVDAGSDWSEIEA